MNTKDDINMIMENQINKLTTNPKIKFFRNDSYEELEKQIADFCKDKYLVDCQFKFDCDDLCVVMIQYEE